MNHLLKQPVSIYRHTIASTTDMGEQITTKAFVATETCNIQVAGEFMSFRDFGFAVTGDYLIFASAFCNTRKG